MKKLDEIIHNMSCTEYISSFEQTCKAAGGGSWEMFKHMTMEQTMHHLAQNGFRFYYAKDRYAQIKSHAKGSIKVKQYIQLTGLRGSLGGNPLYLKMYLKGVCWLAANSKKDFVSN